MAATFLGAKLHSGCVLNTNHLLNRITVYVDRISEIDDNITCSVIPNSVYLKMCLTIGSACQPAILITCIN